MKITINVETNDPLDLERLSRALSGQGVASVATTALSNAKPAAAKAVAAPAPAVEAPATSTAPAQSAIPTAVELTTAINAANAKLGAGGAAKLKLWLSTNFKAADGTPATLSKVQDSDKAIVVAQLGEIAAGTLQLPL